MSTRLAARCGTVAVALCAAAATVAAVPAEAVQTSTFGLAASGSRAKIVHVADGSTIHDSVLVYNRTARPLTVSLDVVGVTRKADGSYSLGASGTGLASGIRLATRSIRLGPKARQVVAVAIDSPTGLTSPSYAAVTAVAGGGASTGVAVTERLAVLVGLMPPGAGASAHDSGASGKRTVAVVVATILLLAVLALLITGFFFRRRRRPTTAAEDLTGRA